MRSIFATVLVIVVIVAGYLLLKGSQKPYTDTSSNNASSSQQVIDNTNNTPIPSSTTTYNNVTQGITFNYPSNFTLNDKFTSGDSWSGFSTSTGVKVVEVKSPSDYIRGTNFRDATFDVGYSTNSSDIKNCYVVQNMTSSGNTGINGATYNKFTLSDAAAGNRYDSTIYRTVHNNRCYSLEYTIHYSNIQNYDPSMNVKEFDENAVKTTLENIVESFKFTK
jgi:hypothetical protein